MKSIQRWKKISWSNILDKKFVDKWRNYIQKQKCRVPAAECRHPPNEDFVLGLIPNWHAQGTNKEQKRERWLTIKKFWKIIDK